MKLNATQRSWLTIEREAYAALVALQKYRSWIFLSEVTVHSDHNPLSYLTESSPKSAKLMRWALALQEFSLTFKYRAGRNNAAADCLYSLGSLTVLRFLRVSSSCMCMHVVLL